MPGALSENALKRGVALFSLAQIPHPISPPNQQLALASKVEGVAVSGAGRKG